MTCKGSVTCFHTYLLLLYSVLLPMTSDWPLSTEQQLHCGCAVFGTAGLTAVGAVLLGRAAAQVSI